MNIVPEIKAALARRAERVSWHALGYARAVVDWGREVASLVPDDVTVPMEPPVPDEIGDQL